MSTGHGIGGVEDEGSCSSKDSKAAMAATHSGGSSDLHLVHLRRDYEHESSLKCDGCTMVC